MNDDPAGFPVEEHKRLADDIRYTAVAIGNLLQAWVPVRSVLDLGCGTGIWLRALAAGGEREVFGVEYEAYRPEDLEIDGDLILAADLGRPLDLRRRFDLVVCLEVAEHVGPAFADLLIGTCVRHADLVLFSAALPGQSGIHHINEQWPDYWAERFAQHGYVVLDLIRPRIWHDARIPVWYRQNMLLFVRDGSPALAALRRLAEPPPTPPLGIAHPDLLAWISNEWQSAIARADAAENAARDAHARATQEVSEAKDRAEEADGARTIAETSLVDLTRRHGAELEARRRAEAAHEEMTRLHAAEREARLLAEAARDAARTSAAMADAAREDAARQAEADRHARDAAEAGQRIAAQRLVEAEQAREDAARQAEADRRARDAAEEGQRIAAERLAEAERARAAADARLADATARLEAAEAAQAATDARLLGLEALYHRTQAQLAEAQRSLSAVTGTLAAVQAGAAALRQRAEAATAARVSAEAAAAESRWQAQAELAARIERDAALSQARQELAAQADTRRLAEERLYILSQDLAQARAQIATLSWERQIILGSALWRMMQPLRRLGRLLPFGLRLRLRRVIGAAETRDNAMPPVAAPAAVPLPMAVDVPVASTPLPAAPHGIAASARPIHLVFVSGEPQNPGHVYRVQRYAEAARALGAEATWLPLSDVVARGEDIARATVMVIWRAANGPEVSHALWVAHSHGVKVLFDIDDLMVDPALATRKVIDGIRSQELSEADVAHHFQRVREVVVQADACTTTTEELARHLRGLDRITFVLPNIFDNATWRTARMAVRRREPDPDGLLRIGYAAGTRTHQRDFQPAAVAVARLLRERPHCRLVLFRDPADGRAMLDPVEYPALARLAAQIEWRDRVPLADLPNELARFDINLAPLEVGNPFCEAKSELKYFEAALVEVSTIASPTGPMRRAIRDGVTGRLADTTEEWYAALRALVDDPAARRRMGHAAYLDALGRWGPQEGPLRLQSVLRQLVDPEEAARAFQLDLLRQRAVGLPEFDIPPASIAFLSDQFGDADVSVIIPLYNYAHYIEEALESVRLQTIPRIDLVVVDDASTDESLQVATDWARRHAARFNRIMVLRNDRNSGLGRSRNTGFNAAETPFVLPLDADNRLRPDCCATLLDALRGSRAAFAYSILQCFGAAGHMIGTESFAPMRFASSNYIDAMALVAKWAWAKVGGYTHIEYGWEDYDFWCKCVEHGMWGLHVRDVLAEYRVHEASMLRTATDRPDNKPKVIRQLEDRHDWLTIARRP